ncbi:hypothetical protein LPJ66_000793 [Kickxella alabastrina]|uniref:Uncharacterized protein n=1 Tax=Kickxella alabastrina TaxID=61397 RepID=A0ACC1IUZ8_9FUNG|nr:hypothetical protein LPJ66_000793 [Kickxella alabastrina]
MQVQDKVAIITGASQGIGRQVAEVLVNKGARVIIADILPLGTQTAQEINDSNQASADSPVAIFQHCDVSKAEDLQKLFDVTLEAFGRVDILVNNAGFGGSELWVDKDSEILTRTIDVNLKAPIDGTRLAIRQFVRANQTGCVVNVASMAAYVPIEFSPVYASTKAGLVSFTGACATLALRTPAIRVNAVAPSFVDTAITRSTPAEINAMLRTCGIITVNDVATQVLRCIEDEELAGDTIQVLVEGSVVHNGPKTPNFGLVANLNIEV